MSYAIRSPFGIAIIIGVVALLALAAAFMIAALRTDSGSSRKAHKADALRRIETVNRGGHLDDMGTIKIDREKQREISDDD
jgi:hypothetical protein